MSLFNWQILVGRGSGLNVYSNSFFSLSFYGKLLYFQAKMASWLFPDDEIDVTKMWWCTMKVLKAKYSNAWIICRLIISLFIIEPLANAICEISSKDWAILGLFDAIVFDHPCIYSRIFTFNTKSRLWCLCIDDIVIIAMWTIFITLVVLRHVFPENFFAFLASERHLRCFCQSMILRFGMTLRAIKP